MTEAEITALVTGIPAILAAVTALVTALKSNKTANAAHARLNAISVPPKQVQKDTNENWGQ